MTGVSLACLAITGTETTLCTWTAWISYWCCWVWTMVTQREYAEVLTHTQTSRLKIINSAKYNFCFGPQLVHRECVLMIMESRERWEISATVAAVQQCFTAVKACLSWFYRLSALTCFSLVSHGCWEMAATLSCAIPVGHWLYRTTKSAVTDWSHQPAATTCHLSEFRRPVAATGNALVRIPKGSNSF